MSNDTHLFQSAAKNLSHRTPASAPLLSYSGEDINPHDGTHLEVLLHHHHSGSLRNKTMEAATLQIDGSCVVLETTDSTTTLFGSDVNHLSDFEDSMDTSIPRGESSALSIAAFNGIGSWAENIPDSSDYRLQVPDNSSEIEAVIRGINRAVVVVRMPDQTEDEQDQIISSILGPALHRRQPLDNISDADGLTRVEQQLNPHHSILFFPEGDGGQMIQTWKEGVAAEGDLENQRDSNRSMEKFLNNNNNHVLQFMLLMSAAGLSIILSYWFWTY